MRDAASRAHGSRPAMHDVHGGAAVSKNVSYLETDHLGGRRVSIGIVYQDVIITCDASARSVTCTANSGVGEKVLRSRQKRAGERVVVAGFRVSSFSLSAKSFGTKQKQSIPRTRSVGSTSASARLERACTYTGPCSQLGCTKKRPVDVIQCVAC